METSCQINVRESFKQIASNLAKVLRKQWPGLGHLIQEKSRRRTSSNINSDDLSNESNSKGGFVQHDFSRSNRTQSMGDENSLGIPGTMDSASKNSKGATQRSRADSYAVSNPIPELDKD